MLFTLQVLHDRLAALEMMLLQKPIVSGRYSGCIHKRFMLPLRPYYDFTLRRWALCHRLRGPTCLSPGSILSTRRLYTTRCSGRIYIMRILHFLEIYRVCLSLVLCPPHVLPDMGHWQSLVLAEKLVVYCASVTCECERGSVNFLHET